MIGHASAQRQRPGADREHAPGLAPRRNSRPADFGRYEALKASLTATATTPAEYEAACRRAAEIAGV